MSATSLRAEIGQQGLEAIKQDIRYHLKYMLARRVEEANPREVFQAASQAVRRQMIEALLQTEGRQRASGAKRLAYLSMEFLMGRALENNLLNLGMHQEMSQSLAELGTSLDAIAAREHDAALGNGGLGRLAACFLDSLATMHMPAVGYGINYEYGLFQQEIDNNEQRERPDHWYQADSPWLIERPDEAILIPIYGRTVAETDVAGGFNPMWLDWRLIVGVPYDFPIVGFGGGTVNVLRLYSARGSDEFDMRIFNSGDYLAAVREKITSETISKVLYPSDEVAEGKELRLVQEYFLVACAVRDQVSRFRREGGDFTRFADSVAMQLNDTHPALTVAELMRVLVDEENLGWEKSWEVTRATLAYTNHTLLPEALERWPVPLMEKVLPRHLQIIFEINRRFLDEVGARWPGDGERQRRMSLIEESEPKQVRMAYLSIVGGHAVNGVAELHSELIKTQLVPDFYQLYPERFGNKTNGITQRRWLLQSNPALASLVTEAIGSRWVTDLSQLRRLEGREDDAGVALRWEAVKRHNKENLARDILELTGLTVNPASLFDVQIKRIHEYKRQLLNVLHIVHLYLRIVEDGHVPSLARTFIFAGKAAPGYHVAKKIIHLINAVAETVNRDPRARDHLKVVFLPDYRVTLAERIVPGADLSEQISTAGKEASGTGNMKLSLNGALTIGTLDGANIEIRQEVGAENFFLFGLSAAEVEGMRQSGTYCPAEVLGQSPELQRVVAAIAGGRFAAPGTFQVLVDRLVRHDEYFHLADFQSYAAAHERVAAEFQDRPAWTRKSILNVARMGKFSSDRTIGEYASDIWGIHAVP